MFAVQIVTTADQPYQLFVARHVVNLSGFVRTTEDIALKTWRTRAGAERWNAERYGDRAVVIEVDGRPGHWRPI